MSLKISLRKLTKNISVTFRIFSQQESKYPHKSISSCCCSLFVRFTVYREPDFSFSHSKNPSQIQKPHGLFYTLRLKFLSFIKNIGFLITTSVKEGLFVTGVQQLEEIFSLYKYEISYIIYVIEFGVTGYSMRNKQYRRKFWGYCIYFLVK